jgi:hypothetical protein
MSKLRFLFVGLPLTLSAGASAISACNASSDQAAPLNVVDGGDTPLDSGGTHPAPDGSFTKPPPSSKDAGTTSDAKPPPPPPTPKDGGSVSDARTSDADLPDAATDDAGTATATPLDPVDKDLMPQYGVDVGTCVDIGLSDSTGLCKTNASTGQDFIEGCVSPETWLLDCQRYETAGSIRSICTDDGVSNVGCHLLFDMALVDDFEKAQTASALDEKHNCPTSWEGYAYCSGNYVRMCVNGKDWALDCTIYNNTDFTYTCGASTLASNKGKITCL